MSESAEVPAEASLQQSTPDWLTPEAGAEDIITPVEDIPGWLAQEAADAGIDTTPPPQGAEWIDTPEDVAVDMPEAADEAGPDWLQEPEIQEAEPSLSPSAQAPEAEPVEEFVSAVEPADELADPPPPWLKEEQASENMTTQEI